MRDTPSATQNIPIALKQIKLYVLNMISYKETYWGWKSKCEDFVSLTLPLVVTAGLKREASLIDMWDTPKSSMTSMTCIDFGNKTQGNVVFYNFCYSEMINLVLDVIIHVQTRLHMDIWC